MTRHQHNLKRSTSQAWGYAIVCMFAVAGIPTVSAAGDQALAIAVEEMPWQTLEGTPLQIVRLWGDPAGNDHAYYLRLPAGFSPGPHKHTGGYHGVNLTGTWIHTFGDADVHSLEPGSYVSQPGGEVHNDLCKGPEDCILYVHQHAPFDFFPAAE